MAMTSRAEFQFRHEFLERHVNALAPPAPLTIASGSSVLKAIEALNTSKQGSICVINDAGQIVGIFTERDIIKKIPETGKALDHITIDKYMTPKPECLKKQASIARAIFLMSNGGFRHLPIVDHDNNPIGVLSVKNFIDYLYQRLGKKYLNESTPISDESVIDSFFSSQISILNPQKPLYVSEDKTVADAVSLLKKHNTGAVLITLPNAHPTGIFTERDYLLKVCTSSINPAKTPITEKMSMTPVTIHPWSTIAEAFELFSGKGFRHLPIVNARDTSTGVVSVKNFISLLSQGVVKELNKQAPAAK